MARTITVYSTKNSKIKKYETDVTTWGDLRQVIQGDYDLGSLKATENINKSTLEHIDTVLPSGDFRLFLRPVKTKSGSDYKEMKFGQLREVINSEGDELKSFLSAKIPGKNWTQLKTVELQDGVSQYFASKSTPTKAKKKETQPVVEETEPVADEPILEVVTSEEVSMSPLDKLNLATQLIQEVRDEVENLEDDLDEIEERLDSVTDDIELVKDLIEDEYFVVSPEAAKEKAEKEAKIKAEKAEREAAEEAARKEKEEMDAELRELEQGFM